MVSITAQNPLNCIHDLTRISDDRGTTGSLQSRTAAP